MGASFWRGLCSEDGAELAALLAADTLAGRAFAQILPELRANAAAIAGAMPRVVKNCSGYRLETVLDHAVPGGGATTGRGGAAGSAAGVAPGDRLVHLQKLFVGAEGTLGLVTEATLNLVPLPRRRGIAMAYFPSVFASGEAVPGILALEPTAVEIMDSRFLALVRKHDSRVDAMLPGAHRHRPAHRVRGRGRRRDRREVRRRCAGIWTAPTPSRWCAPRPPRRPPACGPSASRRWPWPCACRDRGGRSPSSRTSPCTRPRSRATSTSCRSCSTGRRSTPSCTATWATATSTPGPLLDPKDPDDLRTMQRLYDEVSAYVRGIRGTMSGEHGDGLLRTPYLREMYGDAIYSLFSLVKNAFDPEGVMNPGKKVGPQEQSGSLLRDLRYGFDYRTLPQKTHPALPRERVRARDREVPRLRPVQEHGRDHDVPHLQGHPAGARVAPGEGQPAARRSSPGDSTLPPPMVEAATKAVTDYCIVCGMCAVECPSNVNIPKLMLEAKSKYRAAAPRVARRAAPRPRRGHIGPWSPVRPAGQPAPYPAPGPPPGGAAHRHRPAAADAALRPPDLRPDCQGRPGPRRPGSRRTRSHRGARGAAPAPAGRLLLRPLRRLQRPRTGLGPSYGCWKPTG